MAASSPEALSREIDVLFEQYLTLLDRYDTLRKSLSTLQISVQQNIARANFDAPRGVRYGEELYDARMQASRLCSVMVNEEGPAAIRVVTAAAVRTGPDSESTKTSNEENNSEKGSGDGEEENSEIERATKAQPPKARDSIRMFGILTPQALRAAQGNAVKMVEDIIPALISVDAQMKEVEIKIRRARKHRAKAKVVNAKTGSAMNGNEREAPISSI